MTSSNALKLEFYQAAQKSFQTKMSEHCTPLPPSITIRIFWVDISEFWGIYTDIFFVLIETSPLLIQNGNSNLENIWIWKDTKGQHMSWSILMIYLQNYSLHRTKRSRKCKSTCFLRNCKWNLRRFWTTHKCQRHRPFGSKVLLACVQNNWRKAPNSFIRK